MTPCIVCGSTERQELELNGLPLFKCPSCALMRRRTFDMPLSHYEETDPRSSPERISARRRNAHDRIRTLFAGIPKDGVCDVGTGEGTFLAALAEDGGSGVGIEPGRRYREEAARMGVRMVGETFSDVPRAVREEGVRTLTLFHVIEHVERPDEMLRLFYEALPPGGRVIIETPNMHSPVLKAAKYRDPLVYPEHLYYFNEDNLRRLLENAGFRVAAQGRRDFDQYSMSLRQSLRRLLRAPYGAPVPLAPAVRQEGWRGMLRSWLSRRVIATGRLNYMWFVAQK